MLSVYVENIGEMAVVQCEGRIVRSEAAFKLREAVCSQRDARIIVLDLSEVQAIEGGGLGVALPASWNPAAELFDWTFCVEPAL